MTIEAIDLLGDSIYDNQSYVEQGDSVIDQISANSPVHVALLQWMGTQLPTVGSSLKILGMIRSQLLERAFQLGGMMPSRMPLSCWSLAPLCWKPSLQMQKILMNSGSTIVLCLKNCCDL